MKLAEILGIEESFEKIREIASSKNSKPIVINVIGIPCHGKTTFMRKFHEKFYDPNNPDSVRSSHGSENLKGFDEADYFLLHTAITYPENSASIFSINSDIELRKGRGTDINLLVLNPLDYNADLDVCKKMYDLIILNPHSYVRKPLPFYPLRKNSL